MNVLALIFTLSLPCPPLDEGRRFYFEGKTEDYRLFAQCYAQNPPADPDIYRLLSDVAWWENRVQESRHWARRAQDSGNVPKGSELDFHFAERLQRSNFLIEGGPVLSSRRWGMEFLLRAETQWWKKNTFWITGFRESRRFDGQNSWQNDHSFEVGHVASGRGDFYLTKSVAHSFQSEFLPQWRFQLQPHWAKDRVDLSVGFEYRLYSSAPNSFELQPTFFYTWTDRILTGLQLRWGIAPDTYFSGDHLIRWRWHTRWTTQLNLGAGKTNEGEGLIDSFYSAQLGFWFRIHPRWTWGVSGAHHRGDTRVESRLQTSLKVGL